MYLAGNLKFLREQIGKTQQELANLFGVEQKTMSSWECGSRTPGIEIIVELARYHGVSLDDLVLRDMKPAMPVYVLNLMYLRKKHEAESEDTEGKALVMLVVLNRVWSDEFPDTIEDVIFQKGQFSPISNGRYDEVEPDEDCYRALQLIQTGGWDESHGATYFESKSDSTWHSENLTFLFKHGKHYFYKE